MRSGPGEARTILLLYIISDRPSKQPLMVRNFLKVYVELGSYFVSARTNKRHHHHQVDVNAVDHCVQYNRYMGGCEVADMKRALGMSRSETYSSYKWHLALFSYVIDFAVVNAGVVWYSLKGQTAPGRTRQWRMEFLMVLVAEGQGVDQDQFAAMSVPKMAPEAEPKPYYQNHKRIGDNLPKTRLEGNHYITIDPEWVRTMGAEGAKIGRGRCCVCWRFCAEAVYA